MRLEKFSSLLFENQDWKIIFDNEVYSKDQVISCLLLNFEQWSVQGITLNSNDHIICVGFNSLHYFIYTVMASLLNLKIIFTSAQQLGYLRSEYPGLKIQHVLTPNELKYTDYPCIQILFNTFPLKNLHLINQYSNNKDQASIVFFTSGTTGNTKLVMYQESALLNNAKIVGDYFECTRNDICLCIFPTNYMYGFSMLMAVLSKGGTVILERSTISPVEIVDYLNRHNVTVLPILRDIVDKIYPFIEDGQYYFPSLKVINAADKIYTSQLKKILNFAPIFWNNYGQTESGPRLFAVKITSVLELQYYSYQNVVAIGFPVHKEIVTKVVYENSKSAEYSQIGELYYQTPFGMTGYILPNGQLESAPLLNCSGDLVIQKENGLILWAGRKSQTIKINGSFVNINLLHNALDNITDIKQSFFLYDEIKSEIHAFLEVDSIIEHKWIQQKIAFEFKKKFPSYPRISKIHFLKLIPKTITGKIDLKALREHANTN